MAFTREQIEKTLLSDLDWNQFSVGTNEIKQSNSFISVMDYLSGTTSTLAPLQFDSYFYPWFSRLPNLLSDIESPGADDQLVLNILHHPQLVRSSRLFFLPWLMRLLTGHNGKTCTLPVIIRQCKACGMTDSEIFGFFILCMGPDDDNTITEVPELKEYLVNYIRKSKTLVYPNSGLQYQNDKFSLFYFRLLEETAPAFALEYTLNGLHSESSFPIAFFSDYRDGYYMTFILSFLQSGKIPDLRTIQMKFGVALKFYEQSVAQYENLAIEMSLQYLNFFYQNHRVEKWEQGIHWKEFSETEYTYVSYSSAAFHILFKHDRTTTALAILNESLAKKNHLSAQTMRIIQAHLGSEAFPCLEMALKNDNGGIEHYRELVDILLEAYEPSQYLPLVWKLVNHKSRPLRTLAATIVAEYDPEAEAKAIELLENKNADVRQTAALILAWFTSESSKQAIIGVLNREKNDNARDILLLSVADTLPENGDDIFIDNMVTAARERGKLNKPVEDWLDESQLPGLFDHFGNVIDKNRVRFLLYRMSRVKEMRSDIEAKYIIRVINREKSGDFALKLIQLFLDKGSKPDYKYLVALAALLGNDVATDKIRIMINNWIEENRLKMAEYGIGALAINGSDKALRWVEWYSRKYKAKKANVGAAALTALETAAEELQVTIHELGDRIVPDFGFDGLFKHFTFNGDEYRAFIDSNFKIAFFDDHNKKLKSLPATAGTALKEEFKAIAKEVRDIVRSQTSRLEYYLIIQRRWDYEKWQKFFLQNPVMFIYATRLLWGVYDINGRLQRTFLCTEGDSLIDINGDEISIDSSGYLGMVHPSQLDAETLHKWKHQFFELSVEAIFPQLERRMPELKDIDLSRSIITKFSGREMVAGSIRSTLERHGWHKGPTGDGGMVESFHLLHAEDGIEAVLEVEGVGAGYGWGLDEKTGRLYIIDKSKIKQRWFTPPQSDDDERLVKLHKVSPIFLHEMLAAVENIRRTDKTLVE